MEEMTDREMLVAIYGGVEHIKGEVKELKNDVSELKDNVLQLNMRVGNLEADVAELKEDVTVLKEDVTELKSDVTVLKKDVAVLKEDMEETKVQISGIDMTLENEIRNNIRIVAEGHTDIIRKFDDYVAVENGKEMFSIRLNILETDVRNIKEKIGIA